MKPRFDLPRRLFRSRRIAVHASERRSRDTGISGVIEPDRALLPGLEINTDLGAWSVHETPGHAPSHVCLFQPERRLLISGDHLLGRISLYFDYGFTPDPVGEFLHSLHVVERLDARLCLAGHGRTFTDVLALYRFRWQIELAFRRMKSLAGLDQLEAKKPELAQAWIFAKLIAFLIAEQNAGQVPESSPCAPPGS